MSEWSFFRVSFFVKYTGGKLGRRSNFFTLRENSGRIKDTCRQIQVGGKCDRKKKNDPLYRESENGWQWGRIGIKKGQPQPVTSESCPKARPG